MYTLPFLCRERAFGLRSSPARHLRHKWINKEIKAEKLLFAVEQRTDDDEGPTGCPSDVCAAAQATSMENLRKRSEDG